MTEARPDTDNVIRFPTQVEGYINPELLEEKEILQRYVAQLTHPGMHQYSMSDLVDFVIDTSGVKVNDDLPEERLKWRQRMRQIRDQTPGLSDKAYDALVDIDNDNYDEGFAALEGALRTTRDRADELEKERQVLMILMDLRVAAIMHHTDDSSKWVMLAQKFTIS